MFFFNGDLMFTMVNCTQRQPFKQDIKCKLLGFFGAVKSFQTYLPPSFHFAKYTILKRPPYQTPTPSSSAPLHTHTSNTHTVPIPNDVLCGAFLNQALLPSFSSHLHIFCSGAPQQANSEHDRLLPTRQSFRGTSYSVLATLALHSHYSRC